MSVDKYVSELVGQSTCWLPTELQFRFDVKRNSVVCVSQNTTSINCVSQNTTTIMAEALDQSGKGEKVKMRGGRNEEEEKMREENQMREEKREEEEDEEKFREKELTGRQDGWFVVRQAVGRKDLRKKHTMSLQAVVEDVVTKDLMRCNSDGHVETREPELKRDSRSWTQTIRKTSKNLGKTLGIVGKVLHLTADADPEFSAEPLSPASPKTPHRDSGIETELEKAVEDLEMVEKRQRRESDARMEKKIKLEDMLETEKRFLADLQKLIVYKEEAQRSREEEDHTLPMPEPLRDGRDRIAFGNIMKIAEFHRDIFTQGLGEVLHDPEMLKDFLQKRVPIVKDRYEQYCVNKPKSECVVKEYSDYFRKLQHRLGMDMSLSDLLMKPVQMLMRYHMFFEDLARLSEKGGQMRQAEIYRECSEMAKQVSRGANDMMVAGKIEGLQGGISNQGELLKNGKASCKEKSKNVAHIGTPMLRRGATLGGGGRRWESCHIFLFDKCVIVCKEGKSFDVWHQFLITRLTVRDTCGDTPNESRRFELHDAPPQLKGVDFTDKGEFNLTVEVVTQEEKEEWVDRVQKVIKKFKEDSDFFADPTKKREKRRRPIRPQTSVAPVSEENSPMPGS